MVSQYNSRSYCFLEMSSVCLFVDPLWVEHSKRFRGSRLGAATVALKLGLDAFHFYVSILIINARARVHAFLFWLFHDCGACLFLHLLRLCDRNFYFFYWLLNLICWLFHYRHCSTIDCIYSWVRRSEIILCILRLFILTYNTDATITGGVFIFLKGIFLLFIFVCLFRLTWATTKLLQTQMRLTWLCFWKITFCRSTMTYFFE